MSAKIGLDSDRFFLFFSVLARYYTVKCISKYTINSIHKKMIHLLIMFYILVTQIVVANIYFVMIQNTNH